MKLTLTLPGQHPPGDTVQRLRDVLDLARCADRLRFDGVVNGSHSARIRLSRSGRSPLSPIAPQ